MRYYELTLTNAKGQILQMGPNGFTPRTTGRPTFSSRIPNPNGNGTINNPGALNIELDMPVAPFATPQGLQSIRIWGIGLRQIGQSADLNPNFATGVQGAGFTLIAGMAPGLPLATAAAPYAGVIAQGSVFQAFGNWQGVNQTLELVVLPMSASLSPPGGIAFSWLPGQPIGNAIQAALAPAFPGFAINVSIGAQIVQSQSSVTVPGWYESLWAFADMIAQQSQAIGARTLANDFYPGVSIAVKGKTIVVYDGLTDVKTIALKFQDLIGQPTWIGPAQVSFKCVMRGDIQLGDQVTFPTGVISPYALTTSAAAIPGAPSRSSSTFKGTFSVNDVHHFGNFRQPDADSWVTAYTAVADPS